MKNGFLFTLFGFVALMAGFLFLMLKQTELAIGLSIFGVIVYVYNQNKKE